MSSGQEPAVLYYQSQYSQNGNAVNEVGRLLGADDVCATVLGRQWALCNRGKLRRVPPNPARLPDRFPIGRHHNARSRWGTRSTKYRPVPQEPFKNQRTATWRGARHTNTTHNSSPAWLLKCVSKAAWDTCWYCRDDRSLFKCCGLKRRTAPHI